MKTALPLMLTSALLWLAGVAQQLPAHIQKLNRKTDLTTVKFERMLKLSGGRKVYEFSVTSKSQCIRDQIFYSFEHKLNPKLPNCKDCPITMVFYNANYKPEVTFQVGGVAGITANNGYKATDYNSRQKLWILWNAN